MDLILVTLALLNLFCASNIKVIFSYNMSISIIIYNIYLLGILHDCWTINSSLILKKRLEMCIASVHLTLCKVFSWYLYFYAF